MIRRAFLALTLFATLTACASGTEPLTEATEPIGDFRMGFNVVVSNDVQKAPASRDATEEELNAALRAAVEERLGRYDGDGLYHIGLRIEAYSLGRAGIPIVFSPRSIFLIAMNIWDNATQQKLNEEPIRITSYDSAAGPLVGGGLFRDRDAQLRGLAWNAAREVENVLKENAEIWFAPKEGRSRVPFERDPETGFARQTPEAAETDAQTVN